MTFHRFMLGLLALVLLPFSAQAQNFPKRDRDPVVDAAKVLSSEQVVQLTQLSEAINKDTTRQFVVATIPDLEGYDIADYGYQLLRYWKLGDKEANNGIILIVAPKDRKVRIEVGYGLEPIMTDALSSQIINQTILPKFRDGDMPGGIVAGAQAIAEQLKLPLEAAEAKAKEAADKAGARSSKGGENFPFGLLFIGVVLAFVILPMIFRGRRGRRYRGGGDDHWPIILWSIANEIGNSSRGGGSSWSGGDGGGWGGGGGFSGGGGSGGGGGASGSW